VLDDIFDVLDNVLILPIFEPHKSCLEIANLIFKPVDLRRMAASNGSYDIAAKDLSKVFR
jgi:hypothetical protein